MANFKLFKKTEVTGLNRKASLDLHSFTFGMTSRWGNASKHDVTVGPRFHALDAWFIILVPHPNYVLEQFILRSPKLFFAQTVHIKLFLPQAAQLSMWVFIGKSVVMYLHEGPD